jgi:hypothetical protein
VYAVPGTPQARWYDASVSTFVTADPIAADVNLYRYCGNNPVIYVDPSGNKWTVIRADDDRAVACHDSPNDTVQGLAKLIHLDANEYGKWLKIEQVEGMPKWPSSASAPVGQNWTGCFTVPNVVAGYISERAWNDIRIAVGECQSAAISDLSDYAEDHFKVKAVRADSMGTFISMWNDPNLYAFVFGGHGNRHGVAAEYQTEDGVDPTMVHPPYHLAAIKMYACWTANATLQRGTGPRGAPLPATYWCQHLSKTGVFVGGNGYFWAFSNFVSWIGPVAPPGM